MKNFGMRLFPILYHFVYVLSNPVYSFLRKYFLQYRQILGNFRAKESSQNKGD